MSLTLRRSLALLWLCAAGAGAQGMLPSTSTVTTSSAPAGGKLLIGERVADDLTVADSSGTARTLLSFKAPLEILALGVFSTRCAADEAQRNDWRRFYEDYKDWKVVFLGVSVDTGESAADLAAQLKSAGLPIRTVRDTDGQASRALGVTGTPQLILIDEGGILRYRGPLHDAVDRPGRKPKRAYGRDAIEAIIGHVEAVPNAEPAGPIGCPRS